MLLFPKQTRKKKVPKPLKRPSKPIRKKAKFKANLNPFKVYKARRSPEEVRAYAARCRQFQLDNPTPAVLAFESILRELGIDHIREHVIFHSDGTRFVIADFWIVNHRVVFEVDGSVHKLQARYDQGRDRFLAGCGVPTSRFRNEDVLKRRDATAKRIVAILTGKR